MTENFNHYPIDKIFEASKTEYISRFSLQHFVMVLAFERKAQQTLCVLLPHKP
ncbi:hypothetical protein [Chamaesiphon sp. OTE_75_metabat_556]|uniref:hypothetical protein n=1 Tax=Chamaesiphon sp. OTE_75_metabat_556 TaxID=2964692 RepID=UPI00286D49D0|nr:hypothetical protein [Chamaesiphon sp. OTE_75_metabat_556]